VLDPCRHSHEFSIGTPCYSVDGTQGESVSASAADKIKITKRLAAFDVDYIEAGWPGSNPKDAEFFARAQTELSPLEQSKLVAFGSTRRNAMWRKMPKWPPCYLPKLPPFA
jgi:isopropylmalate/homocitrate/citramalate synthase